MNAAPSILADLDRAAKSLEPHRPRLFLSLQTGLGGLRESIRKQKVIPCREVPGFPSSFAGAFFLAGEIEGKRCLALEEGPSLFDGASMAELAFPVWLCGKLGAEFLFLAAGAGALDPKLKPGTLLLVQDHLNLMGGNPLLGARSEKLGPLFPDLANAYDRRLGGLLLRLARRERVPLRAGVLAATAGPGLETRAEKRFLRLAGADAVANSIVPEAIAAAQAGLRTLAVAAITDNAAAPERKPLSIEGMLAAAEEAAPRLEKLLLGAIREVGA